MCVYIHTKSSSTWLSTWLRFSKSTQTSLLSSNIKAIKINISKILAMTPMANFFNKYRMSVMFQACAGYHAYKDE